MATTTTISELNLDATWRNVKILRYIDSFVRMLTSVGSLLSPDMLPICVLVISIAMQFLYFYYNVYIRLFISLSWTCIEPAFTFRNANLIHICNDLLFT